MNADPRAPAGYPQGQPFPVPPPPPGLRPRGRGCLFWGCLVFIGLVLVVVGFTVFAIYILRNEYTAPAPRPVPEYQPKPGEAEAVERRIQEFEGAGAAPAQPARLELTADDLNALITESIQRSRFPGKAFARINGDRLELDLSVSLENVPFLRGRYFNGTVAAKPVLEDGKLRLRLVSATANDQEVPRQFLDQLGKQLSLDDLSGRGRRKSRLQEVLEKARRAEVRDGKIILER